MPHAEPPTVFLLSPASLTGERAAMLLREQARFPLACAVRSRRGAPLGDVFSFLSGLYFRGKAAYAAAFARAPKGACGALVITSGGGLAPIDRRVDADTLRALASIPIELSDSRYLEPLLDDARELADRCKRRCRVVLLGSIATRKYTAPLIEVFGERLLFPPAFVGRGDMSRGGLLLRCARAGVELEYAPVLGAVRHGKRPPRLPRLRRSTSS